MSISPRWAPDRMTDLSGDPELGYRVTLRREARWQGGSQRRGGHQASAQRTEIAQRRTRLAVQRKPHAPAGHAQNSPDNGNDQNLKHDQHHDHQTRRAKGAPTAEILAPQHDHAPDVEERGTCGRPEQSPHDPATLTRQLTADDRAKVRHRSGGLDRRSVWRNIRQQSANRLSYRADVLRGPGQHDDGGGLADGVSSTGRRG